MLNNKLCLTSVVEFLRRGRVDRGTAGGKLVVVVDSSKRKVGRRGSQIATQSPDRCNRRGLRGRSLNSRFDLATERQVDSCRCPFSLCPELIALIPSLLRKSHQF